MGTVIERRTADGSCTFRGEIIIWRAKRIVHRESRSFPKEKDARDWVTSREKPLKKPGALDILIARKVEKITVRQLIARYIAANKAAMGKTKLTCLEAISDYDIADIPCEDLRSADVVAFAQALYAGNRKPQTVQNDLSHLNSVLRIARSAWNIPIDRHLGEDAMAACKSLHLVSKSAQRTRRPTEAELDRLMRHFIERTNRGRAAPMELIIAYAIFSTRRQEEICQITWSDFDAETQTQMVRDMKHPGQKIGNDVRCAVPDNALRVTDENGLNWQCEFAFLDRRGGLQTVVLPEADIHSGAALARAFAERGLAIHGSPSAFRDLIKAWEPSGDAIRLSRPGWAPAPLAAYLRLDGSVLGADPEDVARDFVGTILPTDFAVEAANAVSALHPLVRGNSMAITGVCLGLAGPVLGLTDGPGFGVHLAGPSGVGKSTIARLAMAVWSAAPMRSGEATGAALLAILAQAQHGLIAIDELRPKAGMGEVIYSIGNGAGRDRTNGAGALREAVRTQGITLTTGEISVAEAIAATGDQVHDGQMVRHLPASIRKNRFCLS